MCATTVNLPTVVTFLMLYSLRRGCMTILLWTTFRSLVFQFFFMVSIAEVFLVRASPIGVQLFANAKSVPGNQLFVVFYAYIFMIVTESFLLVSMILLAIGIYVHTSQPIRLYLILRFCTLLSEILWLAVLCLCHQLLIGWYLGFLIFVVLELYAFIVVFSYYMDVRGIEDKPKREDYNNSIPTL